VPSTYSIHSPVRILDLDANVSTLIDEETRWWNIPLAYELFRREEAAPVCSNPIYPGRQEDRRVRVGYKEWCFGYELHQQL
jgi:hypothetical protein